MSLLVRAASLSNYAEVARQFGLNPEAMLREVGLDSVCLQNPDLRIPGIAVLQLLSLSSSRTGNESFGLLMAESRRLTDFGAISLLFRHQASLRSALDTVLQHRDQLNEALDITIDDDGQRTVLRENLRTPDWQDARQAVELAIGVMMRLLRAQLGYQWVPSAVRFRHPAPADRSAYRRIFGLDVQFESDYDGIEFPSAALDQINSGADPAMLRYARQLVAAQAANPDRSIDSEVRNSLHVLLPTGRISIGQVARNLGLTARSLQRRLIASGQTYSELLAAVRREQVLHYLADSRYSLEQIGELLGFDTSSVFSRWFRCQFGQSPRQWRTALALRQTASPSDY